MGKTTGIVNDIVVFKSDLKPVLCVHNIEKTLVELKDFLRSDNERWRYTIAMANFGFREGQIVKNRSGLYVNDKLTRLMIELEPTKYRVLERISNKYGIRNLSVAFARVISERSYFTSPEFVTMALKQQIHPLFIELTTLRR